MFLENDLYLVYIYESIIKIGPAVPDISQKNRQEDIQKHFKLLFVGIAILC